MKVTREAIETVKTVTIAVLITGIIAFVSGMRYQANQTAMTDGKVRQAVTSLKSK